MSLCRGELIRVHRTFGASGCARRASATLARGGSGSTPSFGGGGRLVNRNDEFSDLRRRKGDPRDTVRGGIGRKNYMKNLRRTSQKTRKCVSDSSKNAWKVLSIDRRGIGSRGEFKESWRSVKVRSFVKPPAVSRGQKNRFTSTRGKTEREIKGRRRGAGGRPRL